MLYRSNELEAVTVEKPRGGEGTMDCMFAFQMGKAPDGSALQVLVRQILMPGCSIGYHQHVDNEELYVILSGAGTFYDEENRAVPVGPGDMTLTTKGQSHGLSNSGTEPLVFLAVMAKN